MKVSGNGNLRFTSVETSFETDKQRIEIHHTKPCPLHKLKQKSTSPSVINNHNLSTSRDKNLDFGYKLQNTEDGGITTLPNRPIADMDANLYEIDFYSHSLKFTLINRQFPFYASPQNSRQNFVETSVKVQGDNSGNFRLHK